MDIEGIKTFLAVAQYKSFQKAADALMVTQSTVSRRIQSLENTLDAVLFSRSPKSVSLSPQGVKFLKFAKRIRLIYDDGINSLKKEPRATLTLAVPFSLYSFFPDIISSSFKDTGIFLTVRGANAQETYEMLVDQSIDFGITSVVFPSTVIANDELFREKLSIVASPEYIQKYGKFIDKDHFSEPLPFVSCKLHNFRTYPWDIMHESIENSQYFETIAEVNYFELAKEFAKQGFAASVLPFFEIKAALAAGTLQEIKAPEIVLPDRIIYMSYNKLRLQNKYLQRLMKTIKEYGQKIS
ncbi:MAG: LysR family transcriptional regulator [Gracilibacteraceae bacterium]|jgi:DNA-binding transcriptional LysR family regulator|nr:LysR family transcriptional regulator [Gracilibacteraceae bacterium]